MAPALKSSVSRWGDRAIEQVLRETYCSALGLGLGVGWGWGSMPARGEDALSLSYSLHGEWQVPGTKGDGQGAGGQESPSLRKPHKGVLSVSLLCPTQNAHQASGAQKCSGGQVASLMHMVGAHPLPPSLPHIQGVKEPRSWPACLGGGGKGTGEARTWAIRGQQVQALAFGHTPITSFRQRCPALCPHFSPSRGPCPSPPRLHPLKSSSPG